MEKIAMWGGVAGIVIAIFAIIIIYLTRSNIIDLLDRDVVMYDKNYEIKKDALFEAFNCLDIVVQQGVDVKNNSQYINRAKEAYNGLLCVVNSPKLYQEFYQMAIDTNSPAYSQVEIEKFKIACRSELISKHKSRGEGFKGSTASMYSQPQINQLIKPVQEAPQRPAQPPKAPTQRPAPRMRAQAPVPPKDQE